MTLGSFLVLLAVFVALAIAIVFICNNGGWQGGCGGNCAACRHRCATPAAGIGAAGAAAKTPTTPTPASTDLPGKSPRPANRSSENCENAGRGFCVFSRGRRPSLRPGWRGSGPGRCR